MHWTPAHSLTESVACWDAGFHRCTHISAGPGHSALTKVLETLTLKHRMDINFVLKMSLPKRLNRIMNISFKDKHEVCLTCLPD